MLKFVSLYLLLNISFKSVERQIINLHHLQLKPMFWNTYNTPVHVYIHQYILFLNVRKISAITLTDCVRYKEK